MAARSPGPASSRRDDLTAAAAQHARRPRARGRPSWCPPRASTPGTAHPGSRQPRRETRPCCPCAARQPPASPAEPAALSPPGIPVAAICGVTGRSGSSGRRRSRRDRPGHAAGNQADACCPAAHRTFIQARRRLHSCRGTIACIGRFVIAVRVTAGYAPGPLVSWLVGLRLAAVVPPGGAGS